MHFRFILAYKHLSIERFIKSFDKLTMFSPNLHKTANLAFCTEVNETQFLPGRGCIDTAIWLHYMHANKTAGEEARRQLHKNANVQSWTSPGGNTPQDTNCTATCPLSRKLFKLDEPDMQDTAGEAGTNS